MNVLINLSTLKQGGGQNVAMNFLHGLRDLDCTGFKLYFWVAAGSKPHEFLLNNNYKNYLVLPKNPLKRIIFELTFCRFWIRANSINIVYSYFGYSLLSKNTKQISGSADSNLYFPEIDFWEGFSRFSRLKKHLVDRYRIFGLLRCEHVVYENEAMLERAAPILGLERTSYIKPSIAVEGGRPEWGYPIFKELEVSCLFLCGWQRNKNILLIPYLIRAFRARGVSLTVHFTATYDDSRLSIEFRQLAEELEVMNSIKMVGAISKGEIPKVYQGVDIVFLLSRLESFSNNIIESWFFRRPIVVSDLEWARAICKEAAIYVPRNSPDEIANEVLEFINNKDRLEKLEINVEKELQSYPSISQRITEEFSLIRRLGGTNKT
jgi:glycosyltransferase involved in cell wall biosynthesis